MGDCVRSAVGGGLVKGGCVVDVFLTKPLPPLWGEEKEKNKQINKYKNFKKPPKKQNKTKKTPKTPKKLFH